MQYAISDAAAICKCVYVDCVGFISDVFAIVVQISDVTLA